MYVQREDVCPEQGSEEESAYRGRSRCRRGGCGRAREETASELTSRRKDNTNAFRRREGPRQAQHLW